MLLAETFFRKVKGRVLECGREMGLLPPTVEAVWSGDDLELVMVLPPSLDLSGG